MQSRIKRIEITGEQHKVAFYIDENVFEEIRPPIDRDHQEEVLTQICRSDFAKSNVNSEQHQYIHRIRGTANKNNSSYTLLKLTPTAIIEEYPVEIHNYNYATKIRSNIPESEIQVFSQMIEKSEKEYLPTFIEKSNEDFFSGKISIKQKIAEPKKELLNRTDHANELYQLAFTTFEINEADYTTAIKELEKHISDYQTQLDDLEKSVKQLLILEELYHFDNKKLPDYNNWLQNIINEKNRIGEISDVVKNHRALLINQCERYHRHLENLTYLKKLFAAKIYQAIQNYLELIHQKGSDAAQKQVHGKISEQIYSNALSKDLDNFNARLQPINIRITQFIRLTPIQSLYSLFLSEKMTLTNISVAISKVLTNCQSTDSKAFQEILKSIEQFNIAYLNPKNESALTSLSEEQKNNLQGIQKCSVATTSALRSGFSAKFTWHQNLLDFELEIMEKCERIKAKMNAGFTQTISENSQPTLNTKELNQQIEENLKNNLKQLQAIKFTEFNQFCEQTVATLTAYEKEADDEIQTITLDNVNLPENINTIQQNIKATRKQIEEKITIANSLQNQFIDGLAQSPINREFLQNLLENDLKVIANDIITIKHAAETSLQELTTLIVKLRTELLQKQKYEVNETEDYLSNVELAQSIRQINRESIKQTELRKQQEQQLQTTQKIITNKPQAELDDEENYNKKMLPLCQKFVSLIQDEAYWKKQVKHKIFVKSQKSNPDNEKQAKIPCGIRKISTDIKLHVNWENRPKKLLTNMVITVFERIRISHANPIKYGLWCVRVRKRTTTDPFYQGILVILSIDFEKNKKLTAKELEKLIERTINSMTDKQISELNQHLDKFGSKTCVTKHKKSRVCF